MNKPDTTVTPRGTLRDIIRDLTEATRVQTAAVDSATRAQQFVVEAETALAAFDRTDDAGGDHLAKSIAAWTAGGPRPTLAPPPDVAVQRAGRLNATDDLAACRT